MVKTEKELNKIMEKMARETGLDMTKFKIIREPHEDFEFE